MRINILGAKNNTQNTPKQTSFGFKVNYAPETLGSVGYFLREEFRRISFPHIAKGDFYLPKTERETYKLPQVLSNSEFEQLLMMRSARLRKPFSQQGKSRPFRNFLELPKELQRIYTPDIFVPTQRNVVKLFSNIKNRLESLTPQSPNDELWLIPKNNLIKDAISGEYRPVIHDQVQLVYKTPNTKVSEDYVRPGKIYNAQSKGKEVLMENGRCFLPAQNPVKKILQKLGEFNSGSFNNFLGINTRYNIQEDNNKFLAYSKMAQSNDNIVEGGLISLKQAVLNLIL